MAQDKSEVAKLVLLRGLQGWGQTVDERIKAWQGAFDFMGLSAKLNVGEREGCKVFTFEGTDAAAAEMFMNDVADKFPIGRFEAEQAMIEEALESHKKC
jgi:hypothetical protein